MQKPRAEAARETIDVSEVGDLFQELEATRNDPEREKQLAERLRGARLSGLTRLDAESCLPSAIREVTREIEHLEQRLDSYDNHEAVTFHAGEETVSWPVQCLTESEVERLRHRIRALGVERDVLQGAVDAWRETFEADQKRTREQLLRPRPVAAEVQR